MFNVLKTPFHHALLVACLCAITLASCTRAPEIPLYEGDRLPPDQAVRLYIVTSEPMYFNGVGQTYSEVILIDNKYAIDRNLSYENGSRFYELSPGEHTIVLEATVDIAPIFGGEVSRRRTISKVFEPGDRYDVYFDDDSYPILEYIGNNIDPSDDSELY